MAADELSRIRLQRDLYRRLLELGEHDDLAPFAEHALQLVTEVTGAHRGYLELVAPDDAARRFWLGRGFSESELVAVRTEVSMGIIAETIQTGKTISTASAIDDPRFAAQGSVQAQRIRAVLCVPIGGPTARGVLYLQGHDGLGPFSPEDRQLAEIFAKHLSPLSDRLLAQPVGSLAQDHTAELRAKLEVDDLAGTSRQLANVFQQMLIAAPVDVSVLITGESGTGKTAVARAIHRSSPRAAGPFVELNCAALPEALFESELFGAEKGSHSTATQRRAGKADAAARGTLFLDEIGEMPLPVQSKLLSFAQSKSYYPLGATEAVQADVRIIAATNADLAQLVAQKRFREDLYYRLSVLEMHVAPLRERSQDVGPIAEALCRKLAVTHGRKLPLTRAARIALQEAPWPGNIRQLDNALQRGWATAMAHGASGIEPQHLFAERRVDDGPSAAPTYQEAVRAFQTRFLRQALEQNDWNVSATARRLELSRSHLNDLIKALGLTRPS